MTCLTVFHSKIVSNICNNYGINRIYDGVEAETRLVFRLFTGSLMRGLNEGGWVGTT